MDSVLKNVLEMKDSLLIEKLILVTTVSKDVVNVRIILLVKFVSMACTYQKENVNKIVKMVLSKISKPENVKTVLLLVIPV